MTFLEKSNEKHFIKLINLVLDDCLFVVYQETYSLAD